MKSELMHVMHVSFIHVMKLDIIYLKQAGMALPIKIEIVKCKL